MRTRYGHYTAAFAESDDLVAELNTKLLELDPLIHCAECATEGGFSYDDVDLWALLCRKWARCAKLAEAWGSLEPPLAQVRPTWRHSGRTLVALVST